MALTPKQEAFCVSVASGMNPSDAYQAAQILIKQMDSLMERQGAAVIDPLVVETNARLGEPTQGEQAVAALMALKAKAEARG